MVKRYALNCNISLTPSEKETILRLLSEERKTESPVTALKRMLSKVCYLDCYLITF